MQQRGAEWGCGVRAAADDCPLDLSEDRTAQLLSLGSKAMKDPPGPRPAADSPNTEMPNAKHPHPPHRARVVGVLEKCNQERSVKRPSEELVWTAQHRTIYADRVFDAGSILSVALARITAISLLPAGATTGTTRSLLSHLPDLTFNGPVPSPR